ncbi:MAG: hypothetical protein LBK74_10880 [Treponema sp.]|jgi:hypothetical protein|nr:hypothetical protein [Treponema sp.]
MVKLTSEYSEEYIYKNMLNDANLYMNFNPHNNYFDIELLAYGKVNKKYWKVIMICDEIYQFNLMDHFIDNIENIERYECRPYIILETRVNKKRISETNIGKYNNIKPGDGDFDIFSIEFVGVEKIIKIICKFYKLEIYELTEKEYDELLNI